MNAIIYGRVSTQNQSYQRQEQELQEYCLKEGYEIVGEYFEIESGSHEVRTELTKMFNQLESESVDYVVIWEISRLGRTNEIINSINRIHKTGCGLISRKESIKTNVKDENGLIMANLLITFLSGINTFELSTFKHRSMSGLKRNVRKGGVVGTLNYPYGYMNDGNKMLVINKEESIWIKKIFDLYLAGYGTTRLAQFMNENNVETRAKKNLEIRNKKNEQILLENSENKFNYSKYNYKFEWTGSTIYSIIKNSIYKGVRMYKGEEIHQPSLKIIEPEIFDLVQKNLKGNVNKNDKHTKNEYIINSNKIFCGCCGLNFYAYNRTAKVGKYGSDKRYLCLSNRYKIANKNTSYTCENISISISKIENLIHQSIFFLMTEKLIQILDDSDINNRLDILRNDEQQINKQLKELEGVQENIFNWMVNKTFNKEFLDKKLNEYNTNKEVVEVKAIEVKTKINSLLITKANLNDVEQIKKDFKSGQKLSKEVVNKIISKIIITKQNDFENTLDNVNIYNQKRGDKVLQVKIYTENNTELIFYISQRTNFILLETISGLLRMEDFFDGSAPRKMYDFLTTEYE
jgi:site-specific DNA recombinase